MKNIPRIFVGDNVQAGDMIDAPRDTAHYLRHVMRRRDFLCFGGGREFNATLSDDNKKIIVGAQTAHADPSGNIKLYFAPIKKTDDLMNMATQMGVGEFIPVITMRTVANHINWDRMQKIVTEAAEQSNRNSVPKIHAPIKFEDMNLSDIVFADERAAYGADLPQAIHATSVFIGPEGGFSDSEFAAMDAAGARGISLGATILRAEVAAVVAIAHIMGGAQ